MKTTFEDAVERMRAFPGGQVQVRDYAPVGRTPYRHATLDVLGDGDTWREMLIPLAELCIATGAHLLFWSHYNPAALAVSLSRDLTVDEIDALRAAEVQP